MIYVYQLDNFTFSFEKEFTFEQRKPCSFLSTMLSLLPAQPWDNYTRLGFFKLLFYANFGLFCLKFVLFVFKKMLNCCKINRYDDYQLCIYIIAVWFKKNNIIFTFFVQFKENAYYLFINAFVFASNIKATIFAVCYRWVYIKIN